ncbi:Reverse transcriptase RNA-dependent DNA polymerase [Ceratocystis lukuohia]|uniref:Reverse transcriptase RNA-dependent DNA polymerase n=1 Tax=Ceratocystis lukuohia TaxID=2019550 RepID=A0ABR4MJV0_9PEZI
MEAAVYLLNRTPTRPLAIEDEGKLRYRTPFEALHRYKPSLAHRRPYGCKAYLLIHKILHRMKLQYRAHIGYLVGYHSTNIFQIWVLSQQAVIHTRDVTFDEKNFYDPRSVDLAILQPIQHFISTIEPDSTETDELHAFERKIAKIYETNFLGPASWFLGVRILRDRSQWKLWLVQDMYTKQLITKFNIVTTHKYQTPVRPDNMAPRESTQAQPDFVNLYQQKVGSLNWPAVVTRPDIAFAASQLARFMSNADRALAYLASTPTLAIEYSLDAMESVFKVYESVSRVGYKIFIVAGSEVQRTCIKEERE